MENNKEIMQLLQEIKDKSNSFEQRIILLESFLNYKTIKEYTIEITTLKNEINQIIHNIDLCNKRIEKHISNFQLSISNLHGEVTKMKINNATTKLISNVHDKKFDKCGNMAWGILLLVLSSLITLFFTIFKK